MRTKSVKKDIRRMVNRIVQKFQPERIILFALCSLLHALCQAEGFARPPRKIGFEVSEKSPTYRTASEVARTTDNEQRPTDEFASNLEWSERGTIL